MDLKKILEHEFPPKIEPLESEGDHPCGTCKAHFSNEKIKREGIFKYGTYWANCINCNSTLMTK